ncbi:hypothetical protein L218DRAFT_1077398 [Marasmius fiardii PR-910]|nr:hypothetical protein L218DRAFT_1077398 [Marasmius fiardii PR-910]
MSKNVTPWILEYLIDVGQQHGANISAFPITAKKKSVQIVKFLSYGSKNIDEDSIIWARVSDKKHEIPVRFSKESVAEHRRASGHRLTSYPTSLITIKEYRLILMRIPIPNGDKMTTCSHLALDCTEFSSRGCYGESVWDKPQDAEDVSDVKEWVAGLRKGGGDGNLLKERKKNQNGQKSAQNLLPDHQKSPPRQQPQRQLEVQPISNSRLALSKGKRKAFEDTHARTRERRWVANSRYPVRYSTRPEGWKELVKEYLVLGDDEIITVTQNTKAKPRSKKSHPLDLGSSQPFQSQPKFGKESANKDPPEEEPGQGSWPSQQATPPPSGSPEPQSPGERRPARTHGRSASLLSGWGTTSSEDEEDEQAHVSGVSESNLQPSSPLDPLSPSPSKSRDLSSSLQGPNPAQRKRIASSFSQGVKKLNAENHESSGLPIASSPDMFKTQVGDRQNSMSPSKSSSSVSRVLATQTIHYLSSPSTQYGKNLRRKVSPPPQPQHLPLGENPVILAPNSDTSGSQGQTQSQVHASQEREQVKRRTEIEVEEVQDKRALITPISLPAAIRTYKVHTSRGAGKLSQGSIIPETQPTQPQGSEYDVHDEAQLATGDAQVREVEVSLEVHPGTVSIDHAGPEDEKFRDHGDRQNQQLIYRSKETDLDHDDLSGENTGKHSADEDDAQTLEFLYGSRNPKPEIRYKAQDWVKPSFMGSSANGSRCRGSVKNRQQHNSAAGSSKLTKEPCKGDSVPSTDSERARTRHRGDERELSLKGKKRRRSDRDLEDGDGEGDKPVNKKTRVKHDAACRNTIATLKYTTDREPKLNGYMLGLDNIESSESWMMTWERLGRILLATGRTRVHNLKNKRS